MSKQPVATFMADSNNNPLTIERLSLANGVKRNAATSYEIVAKTFYSRRRFKRFFCDLGLNGFAVEKIWELSQKLEPGRFLHVRGPKKTVMGQLYKQS